MAQSQAASVTYIGKARARIDGPLKVTGTARYTSDHNLPGMLYAVPVGATIAKGKITAIDIARARQMPGVRAVLKRGDLPPLKKLAVNSCVIRTFRNALENRLSAEKTVSYPLKFRSWMLTPRHDRRKSARSGSAEIRSQINAFSGVRRRVVYVGN